MLALRGQTHGLLLGTFAAENIAALVPLSSERDRAAR